MKVQDGGCVLAERGGGATHVPPIPPVPVPVEDTTGAGNAFTGALAVALPDGKPARDAALFAVAASRAAVSARDSQSAYPDRARIEALLLALAAGARDLRA